MAAATSQAILSYTGNPSPVGNHESTTTGTAVLPSGQSSATVTCRLLTPKTFIELIQTEAGELGLVEVKASRTYGNDGTFTVSTANGGATAADRDFQWLAHNF